MSVVALTVPLELSDAGAVIPVPGGGASGNGVIFTVDTAGFNSISVQLSGIWVANVAFETSNNTTDWTSVQGFGFNSALTSNNTATVNDVYLIPVTGRFFRLNVFNYVTGPISVTGYLRFQSIAGFGEAMISQAMDSSKNTPMNVTFTGVTQAGQSPAVNSVPVTLSNENIRDRYISSRNIGTPLNSLTVIPMDGAEPISTNPGGWIDVSQYRSIYVNMVCQGNLSGTITIECSNDGINLLTTAGFNFYDTQVLDLQLIAPGSGAMSLGNNKVATRVGNLTWRYVRFRVTTAITGSGTVAVTAMLRMTIAPYNTSQVNTQGLASNLPSTPSSMTTAGTVSATYPFFPLGGADRSIIRSEMIGNMGAGGIAQSYLTNGPYARSIYTDLSGSMGVAGPQPFLAEDKTYPVNVRLERTTRGQDSVQDLLQQVLVELKALNYYTREMPTAIVSLMQSPNAFAVPASMQDDPENFFDDSTLSRLQKGH